MKSQVSQFFRTNNPLREISKKSSSKRGQTSCHLVDAMNDFEETIIERMKSLIPRNEREVGSLEWIKSAMECLCAVHVDIQNLIASLNLQIITPDEKLIETYFDTSVKLLDLCIAFSSEIARLNQGNFFVLCAVHELDRGVQNQMMRVRSSFASWDRNISSRNKRMENCSLILNSIVGTMNIPKTKGSAKGKALMSGMYGMRVLSVFLCGVLGTIFTGSSANMVEFRVPDSYKWGAVYADLQRSANGGLKKLMAEKEGALLIELNLVDDAMRKIGRDEKEWLNELRIGAEKLSDGLNALENQCNCIFKVVLGARDGLLTILRSSTILVDKIEIPNLTQQIVT